MNSTLISTYRHNEQTIRHEFRNPNQKQQNKLRKRNNSNKATARDLKCCRKWGLTLVKGWGKTSKAGQTLCRRSLKPV